jgi:hypothetical protein
MVITCKENGGRYDGGKHDYYNNHYYIIKNSRLKILILEMPGNDYFTTSALQYNYL